MANTYRWSPTAQATSRKPRPPNGVVQQGLDRFGRIDTLVNNAGIYIGKPFTDYTVDDYVAITSVNLTGFFHMTQQTIAQMVAQVEAASSMSAPVLWSTRTQGNRRPLPSLTQRRAKGGDTLARHRDAGPSIRVIAVALGIIETPLDDPASYRELAKRHPLGRVGEVSDVVDGGSLPRTRDVRHRCDVPY